LEAGGARRLGRADPRGNRRRRDVLRRSGEVPRCPARRGRLARRRGDLRRRALPLVDPEARGPTVKATLHDELMHEAGFETEYHSDLERRREQRHQLRLRAVAGLPWLVLGVAGVVELWGRNFPGIPRPVVVAAIVVG